MKSPLPLPLPLLLLVLLLSWHSSSSSSSLASASPRGVTNEDIRDAILSLIHMFRDSTDKLERHEYRERTLGDHVKRALAGLDKRMRQTEQNGDALAATLAKIDERLRAVEAKIDVQNGERDKGGVYTVDTVQGSIQTWTSAMEALVRNATTMGSSNTEAMEAALSARLDRLASSVERLEVHLLRPTSTAVAAVDTEGIVGQLESRLARLQQGGSADVQMSLDNLRQLGEGVARAVAGLATQAEVAALFNGTHEQLHDIKYELIASADKGFLKVEQKLADSHKALTEAQDDLHKTASEAGVMAEGFYGNVQKSYEQLSSEVKGLAKVEQVMIQTADNVLDTKRRIEYGVHQILVEVGDLVQTQAKELNATVNKRFDNISISIMENQNGALTNISSKIETEISQVWRQIGIMYQQLTASAGALDRLQQQTDAYVNGSLHTMDSMEGKVGQITGRMGEVDDNLNYLLGRLSLVTQEFNQIKTGLGQALDSIKGSFKAVQEQIKEVGPGPNPIPTDETDADNRL